MCRRGSGFVCPVLPMGPVCPFAAGGSGLVVLLAPWVCVVLPLGRGAVLFIPFSLCVLMGRGCRADGGMALSGLRIPWAEWGRWSAMFFRGVNVLAGGGSGFGCLRRTMGPPRLLVSPAQMRGPGLGLWICRRDNYLSDALCSPACSACVCLGFSARPVGGLWCRSKHNDLSGLVPRAAGAMGSRCAVWCWARSGVVLPLGGVEMSAPSSCPVIFRPDNPLG